MATAVFAGCSNDEILESYQGEEISFRTRIETRATELSKTNLGDFSVIAKGIHPTGNLYTAYLIGEMNETTKIITGETAKKDPTMQTIWKLGRDVYWPSGMEQVLFWAYTTQQDGFQDKEAPMSNGTVKFNENGPIIEGFEPVHASLTENNEIGIYADGGNQKDLLVAFTEQNKSKGTSVSLTFKHALSQIDIKAYQKEKAENDHRIVKVKGAWIVNVNNKGNLQSGFTWDIENKIASEKPEWGSLSNPGIYGTFFNTEITLNTTKKPLLGSGGELMIIPQKVEQWNLSADNTSGAYILLLCRIELEHDGTTHTGSTDDINIVNNKHYHQLFPVANEYDSNMYGFSCVPLKIDWTMGTKYTYNLDICGATTGAGYYPPTISEDMLNKLVPSTYDKNNINSSIPENKSVGSLVLDDPIKFDVSVEDWNSTEHPEVNEDISLK